MRLAVPEDIPECVALRGRTRENSLSVGELAAMGITAESWAEEVNSGLITGYVCVADQAVVGFCFGEIASGEVLVLAVLPTFENRGIGVELLKAVVGHLVAHGHKRVFLGCTDDPATRAHGFYRRLGWVSSGMFDGRGDEVLELFPLSLSKA